MRRIHVFVIGILLGLIGPLIGLYIYGSLVVDQLSLSNFDEFMEHTKSTNVESKVLSFSLLFNLLLFFIFINIKKWFDATRGIILASLIWAVPIIYYLFFS